MGTSCPIPLWWVRHSGQKWMVYSTSPRQGKFGLAAGWRPEPFITWDLPQSCLSILTTWRLTPGPHPQSHMDQRPQGRFQCLLSLSLNSHVHVPLSVLFRAGGHCRKCKKSRRPESSLGAALRLAITCDLFPLCLDGPGTRQYVRLHLTFGAVR